MMVLMENRTAAIYDEIFKWLTEQVESLKTRSLHIMSDFEKATVKALRKNFPLAQIHGCYFHFVHAVIKNWQAHNLKIPDYFLSMMLSVPLLPENLIPQAEKVLNEEMEKIKHLDVNIIIFMNYFKTTWLAHPNHISVFEALTATNDGPESFHRHCKCRLGGSHPDVWTLIGINLIK
ncbi:uncharacterized protein LOC130669783 [Microplitis mediator]|uniref:uncharacterized protein LOC130669783 n=1 Tax=Microplitis mediator TaxID=375433 RepID=UPI0025534497|nr:uncharacterized protein LOC130669783 [Microplitis mediator]